MNEPLATIERLVLATNQHDIEALVACFAEDYQNETPAHPARGFRGRAQVRRNWDQIFAFVPDIAARIIRSAADGETVWTEWEMHGTRGNATPHQMCGPIVFGVEDGLIRWARFYLEPVDASGLTVDDAVREQVRQ
ncbi:MAG TPA: nuclear transport factor 2 family protein [Candidatus Dormibacteraeota bacterium]|nr:nuclear transport factor 2 family protein [Candidatus Dormibacteraeota bacterium]